MRQAFRQRQLGMSSRQRGGRFKRASHVLQRKTKRRMGASAANAFSDAAAQELDSSTFVGVPATPDLDGLRACVDYLARRDPQWAIVRIERCDSIVFYPISPVGTSVPRDFDGASERYLEQVAPEGPK